VHIINPTRLKGNAIMKNTLHTVPTLLALFALVSLITGCSSNSTPPATASSGSGDARAAAAAMPSMSKTDPVYKYVDAMRADMSRGKVQIINEIMTLSADEAKIFWPIYHDYESESFALGDRRMEVIRKFGVALDKHTLNNTDATELADGYFRFEAARLDLVKKYHATIARDLSPVRAAQFTQIEHRVGTVIDLLIASELPLIHGETPRVWP